MKLTTLGDRMFTTDINNSNDTYQSTTQLYVADGCQLRKLLKDNGINMRFLPVILGYLDVSIELFIYHLT